MTLNEQITWCKAQIKSGYEVVVIRSIMARLTKMKEKEPPNQFHNNAMAIYISFLESRGLKAQMIDRPKQGAALKKLLLKLKESTETKSDEGAFNAFKWILENWGRLNSYHANRLEITDINRDLLKILNQIRNGATKQDSAINEAKRFHNELTQ